MYRSLLLLFLLVVFCAASSIAEDSIRVNSGHSMTAGSFGVAFLDPQGTVLVYDGTAAPAPLPESVKAVAMTAADISGDGKHELALLGPTHRGLLIYDFAAKKLSGPFGSNITDLSAVRFDEDEAFDSIAVGTLADVSYRWFLEIGGAGWPELPGSLQIPAAVDFDTRSPGDEIAAISNDNLYLFNPRWGTYKQVLMGKGARLLATGPLTGSNGGQIVAACGTDYRLYLCERRKTVDLDRSGVKLAVGRTATGNVLCAIAPEGSIGRYSAADAAWTDKLGGGGPWRDILLADLDGADELFALPKDDAAGLHRLDSTSGEFVPVTQ